MSLDLVVFDLDGTLVDSLPDIASALNGALEDQGLARLTQDVVGTLVGDGILALATRALAQQNAPSPVTAEELARAVWNRYVRHPCVDTRPYDEILDTLASLRAENVPLAVLTNKPGDIARLLLGSLGMDALFLEIVGDGDGFPRKPDPGALVHLMARVGAKPERTLMVGDGLPDMAVARAAGCIAVAALWGYTPRALLLERQPDNALLSPSQLLNLP